MDEMAGLSGINNYGLDMQLLSVCGTMEERAKN